ncbi:MAG: hypothetical protein JW809_00255 [Pirellulales bacterium]|nr:hypothetical protein [Pirellulales bacterium]
MILPYNTDAPIDHWPVATVGQIVVNTAVLAHFLAATPGCFAVFDGRTARCGTKDNPPREVGERRKSKRAQWAVCRRLPVGRFDMDTHADQR